MRTISQTASKTLNKLTDNLGDSDYRKLGKDGGTFMPVIVELLECFPNGSTLYSVAHYYKQNGDLCPDPEMEFLKTADGKWYTVSITQPFGVYRRAANLNWNGDIGSYYPRAMREMCSFTTTWMKNIKWQQDL